MQNRATNVRKAIIKKKYGHYNDPCATKLVRIKMIILREGSISSKHETSKLEPLKFTKKLILQLLTQKECENISIFLMISNSKKLLLLQEFLR